MAGPARHKAADRIVTVELPDPQTIILDFDVYRAPRYQTAADAVADIRAITGHAHNVYARFTTATGKPWPLPVDRQRQGFIRAYVRGTEAWCRQWRTAHAVAQRLK